MVENSHIGLLRLKKNILTNFEGHWGTGKQIKKMTRPGFEPRHVGWKATTLATEPFSTACELTFKIALTIENAIQITGIRRHSLPSHTICREKYMFQTAFISIHNLAMLPRTPEKFQNTKKVRIHLKYAPSGISHKLIKSEI